MNLHDGCRSDDWRLYRETRRRLDPHVAQPKAGPRSDAVSEPNENFQLGGGPCGKVVLLPLLRLQVPVEDVRINSGV
jgi:hypothetical protein